MTIRHLFIFKTVCEEMNFTRAAERLFMTQPAVSHVIAELEKEAGTPLFDRRTKKIALNGRGRLLLEKTVRLLELYEDMEGDLKGLERKAVLRIGSSITIANFWLPYFVKRFEEQNEGIPLQIEVDSAANVAGKLERGELDLALIEGASYISQFEDVPFSSYEVTPICSPAYRARVGGGALANAIKIEEFAAMPLLLREKGSAIRDVLDGVFIQHGLLAKPYWVSVNSQALIQAAIAGLGVTVLPLNLAKGEIEAGRLVELPVEGLKLRNANHIVYHKAGYITSPMQKFIDLIKAEFHLGSVFPKDQEIID